MNIDAILLSSLETLSLLESNNNVECLEAKIPFGNIAFIKEKFWKLGAGYKESAVTRKSHPGLSISENGNKIAFGSSQLNNRDRNDKNYFFVNKNECEIISKNMVFLLDTCIPTAFNMIDKRKTLYSELCPKKMKELKDVISKKQN